MAVTKITKGDRFEDSRGYKLTVERVSNRWLWVHYDSGTAPGYTCRVARSAAEKWTRLALSEESRRT